MIVGGDSGIARVYKSSNPAISQNLKVSCGKCVSACITHFPFLIVRLLKHT
jgi:predicted molibdopterin-dependent oxidoreductase YjgC